MKTFQLHRLIILALMLQVASTAFPQGTAFMYHGRLQDNGSPANGSYDLTFSVFDAGQGGNQIGSMLTNMSVNVADGVFAAVLDFDAGVFTGPERWLETGVHTNGVGDFTTLSPRQLLTPTPYAIMANVASNLLGTLPAEQLSGTLADVQLPANIPRLSGNATFSGVLTLNNPANNYTGNGTGLTDINASNLTSGTVADARLSSNVALLDASQTFGGSNVFAGVVQLTNVHNLVVGTFFGDGSGLTNLVGGVSNVILGPYATVAGGVGNSADGMAGFVGGGSENTAKTMWSAIGAGKGNSITSGAAFEGFETVAGGWNNRIADASESVISGGTENFIVSAGGLARGRSTIGGGYAHLIQYAYAGTIGGGEANLIYGNGSLITRYATIGGGLENNIIGTCMGSTIAGGKYNSIEQSSLMGTEAGAIGGGSGNLVTGGYGTIAGGQNNTISKSMGATIGGGGNNLVQGDYGTIAGGVDNAATNNYTTISGGSGNLATNEYATVGGGHTNSSGGYSATIGGGAGNSVPGDFGSIPGGLGNTATNFGFAAGRRAQALHTGSLVWADSSDFDFTSTTTNEFSARCVGGARLVSAINAEGLPTAGVQLVSGGGSWSSLSDYHAKENFGRVNAREVLERVTRMRITTWNYKTQNAATRHIGPVAQDFKAAFNVGSDDLHIATVDADGVALAAIQGLNELVKEKDARIQALETRLVTIENLLQALVRKNGGTAR